MQMFDHPFPDDRAFAVKRAKKLFELNPLFLDTETTGLGDFDQVCEIAVIDLAGEVLINSLVKPTIAIPEVATRIHGITNEMVQESPSFQDLLHKLDEVLNDRTVVVYNVDYDVRMLWNSAMAHKIDRERFWWSLVQVKPEIDPQTEQEWSTRWFDLMEPYSAFYGAWTDYHQSYRWQRLGNAARQCGITLPDTIHRAHADAEMARRILLYVASTEDAVEEQTTTNQTQGDQNAEL